MALLAKTSQQVSKLKCAIMMGMTSGFFRNRLDPNQQEFVEKLSRTLGFVPGRLIIIPTYHPKMSANLLDAFSGGKFSKITGRSREKIDNEP